MPATVIINRWTGASPGTPSNVAAGSRASMSDIVNPGDLYPILIPLTGNVDSFWLTFRAECTVSPDTLIDNFNVHPQSTLSMGAGFTWIAQLASTGADDGYRQATGTLGETGTLLNTTNHTGLNGAPVDFDTITAGAPLALTGSFDNTQTGHVGEFLVMQFNVTSAAGSGVKAAQTLRWNYDEA